MDRAQRLLDDRRIECVERGYLRYASGLRSIFTDDVEAAHSAFAEAVAMGELCREPELTTLARIGQGRCAIYLGEVIAGSRCWTRPWWPLPLGRSRPSPWAMRTAR